jgi:hypothetical protein
MANRHIECNFLMTLAFTCNSTASTYNGTGGAIRLEFRLPNDSM